MVFALDTLIGRTVKTVKDIQQAQASVKAAIAKPGTTDFVAWDKGTDKDKKKWDYAMSHYTNFLAPGSVS